MALRTEDIRQLMEDLKSDQASPYFLISPETYHTLQRIISQRPHQRKLRKCWLRKMCKRRKRERKRYV